MDVCCVTISASLLSEFVFVPVAVITQVYLVTFLNIVHLYRSYRILSAKVQLVREQLVLFISNVIPNSEHDLLISTKSKKPPS